MHLISISMVPSINFFDANHHRVGRAWHIATTALRSTIAKNVGRMDEDARKEKERERENRKVLMKVYWSNDAVHLLSQSILPGEPGCFDLDGLSGSRSASPADVDLLNTLVLRVTSELYAITRCKTRCRQCSVCVFMCESTYGRLY